MSHWRTCVFIVNVLRLKTTSGRSRLDTVRDKATGCAASAGWCGWRAPNSYAAVKIRDLRKETESMKVVKPGFTCTGRCRARFHRSHECGETKNGTLSAQAIF